MSLKAMAAVFELGFEPNLSAADRLMLLALADHADEHNECWPSYEHLARKCGVTRRNAIKTIGRLEKLGRLVKKGRHGDSGLLKSNVYEIIVTPVSLVTPISPISDADDTSLVTPVSLPLVTPTTPKPSIEPSVEPKENPQRESAGLITPETILESYNTICVGRLVVGRMTAERRKHLLVRLKEPTFTDNFQRIFTKAAASDFLNGKNGGTWTANFGWLVKNAENYVKVLDGNYDNKDLPKRVTDPASLLANAMKAMQ